MATVATTRTATAPFMMDLALGTAANLLFGVKPVWSGRAEGFFAPPTSPTTPVETLVDVEEVAWSLPVLTLHDDAESLLSTLYGYDVSPAFHDRGSSRGSFSVPAGPLALSDSDSAASLAATGEYVGLDLTAEDTSFMLVRLRRCVGRAVHPSIASFGERNRDEYLTAAARRVFNRLPTGAGVTEHDQSLELKLTADEATEHLNAMYQFGTHFVSEISAGDVLFQVFAYPAARYSKLSDSFDKDKDPNGQVTGSTALAYQYFTSPRQTGPEIDYGYVSQYGRIAALSGDPLVGSTVKAGDWDDARYAKRPSIFQAYAPRRGSELLIQFRAVAPIVIGLAPLSDLVRKPLGARVHARLLNGALLQKYGDGVVVPFASARDIDWEKLLPGGSGVAQSATSSWLSTVATPTIDVYQEVVDLASVQMINTSSVRSFTVMSMVLHVTGATPDVTGATPIDLPGTKLTIASFILDASANTTVPTLRVTPEAFDSMEIAIGEMYGAVTIASTDRLKRDVLLDGLRFTSGPVDPSTQRSTVALAGDVLAAPRPETMSQLVSDLEFSVVSAESRMWGRPPNQEALSALIVGYLEWLARLVPVDSDHLGLVTVGARAQYLAKAALQLGGYGVRVPYLTFAAYKDYVASMSDLADDLTRTMRDYQERIDRAKHAEQAAQTAQEINANIKATGELLTDYFGVLADNQNAMADYYGDIANQRREEFATSVTNIADLADSLAKQQLVVQQAVTDFQQAVTDWQKLAILKLCFAVALDVFNFGSAISIPSTELNAVKSLGETAQKIQKVMNVLAALSKLQLDLEPNVRSLAAVQQALGQLEQPLAMPSSLEWQEFSINMKASLAAVPGELAGPKSQLTAAFDILALRGQALVNARTKQAQILTDIYFNERQRDINAGQAERLADLRDSLNLGSTSPPDLPKVDLIGLTGQIQAQLKQVLVALAKTLVLQDGAVQYTYLGEPTPIQKFDLTSLRYVMQQQQRNILDALTNLNPPPIPVTDPIEYRIAGVPVASLANGAGYPLTIQPSASEFWKYAMVRIDKVLVRIEGIAGSTSGEYLAKLSFDGDAFEDRDADRAAIAFNTVARHFGPYNYEIGGRPLFGDKTGETEAKITKITPFGTWQISLPATSINHGITFVGPTVDIVLSFKITALLADTRLGTQSQLTDVVQDMYDKQTVLNDWDVVFNVMTKPVNEFLQWQYNKKYGGQDMVIQFPVIYGPEEIPGVGWYGFYHKYRIELGGPLLRFLHNNDSYVKVTQKIKAAHVHKGSKKVTETWNPAHAAINDAGVEWNKDESEIKVGEDASVDGTVALGTVQGIVKPHVRGAATHSVVLEFAEGSFDACLEITVDSATFRVQLSNWFKTNPITYVVSTVDFSEIGGLVELTPTRFVLRVLHTNKDNYILQHFITTSGAQHNNTTINLQEPIPDGYNCSLLINNKIMFGSAFVYGFNQGASDFEVEAVPPPVLPPPLPPSTNRAWSAKIKNGNVSATIDIPSERSRQFRIDKDGNRINWSIDGLAFTRTKEGTFAVELGYTKLKSQPFQSREYVMSGQVSGGWTKWKDYSVDVTLAMTGYYPIKIRNSGEYAGKNQTIEFEATSPHVNVSNTTIKPTGPCACDDRDLQIRVRDALSKDLPATLREQMKAIKFRSISIFALQSLVFPGGELILMQEARIPGDLLVVGTFTPPKA